MKDTNEILSQIQTTIANQFGRTIAINESKMSVSYSIAKAIIGNDENNNVIDAVKEGLNIFMNCSTLMLTADASDYVWNCVLVCANTNLELFKYNKIIRLSDAITSIVF